MYGELWQKQRRQFAKVKNEGTDPTRVKSIGTYTKNIITEVVITVYINEEECHYFLEKIEDSNFLINLIKPTLSSESEKFEQKHLSLKTAIANTDRILKYLIFFSSKKKILGIQFLTFPII